MRVVLELTIIHETRLTSTMDTAMEAVRGGAPEGMAWRADMQTGGRGRHGRIWSSPEGNLYLSVILRPRGDKSRWPSLSLMAGLALRDAIAAWRDAGRMALKWPNDVLYDGRKCAGLLLEAAEDAVVLGCGVNCASAPPPDTDGKNWPAGIINDDGDTVITPDMLAGEFANTLARRYENWQAHGIASMRDEWLAASAHHGKRITLSMGDGNMRDGIFENLADSGALILRCDDGAIHEITAGEVLRAIPDEMPIPSPMQSTIKGDKADASCH